MSEKIVQLNEEVIKGQIKELVRGSVEETLNELLEKEAESLTQAARYERSEARQGYRSGHYDRNLTTTSGDVTLHMPRLKEAFEIVIIERYRRGGSRVEKTLIEMYLVGVSVRRVEAPPKLCGTARFRLPPSESWTRRPMSTSRIGGIIACRMAGTHMLTRAASIYAATEESTKMLPFWWRLP